VQYHLEGHGSVCEGFEDFAYNESFNKTMKCYNGYTDVGIFIHLDDEVNIDECQECKPPSSDNEKIIAYYFEVPCEPICEPFEPTEIPKTSLSGDSALEEPEYVDGIAKISEEAGDDDLCDSSFQPLRIEESADLSTDNQVQFSVTNHWNLRMGMKVCFDRGANDGSDCQSLPPLDPDEMYPVVLSAACDETTGIARVELCVSNEIIGNQLSGESQCGETEDSCSYVFDVKCNFINDAGGDRMRKLENNFKETFEMDSNVVIARGFRTDEMRAPTDLNDEPDDVPYCLHKDYPCKGDEDNMVHVCHYSSQAGYQTFCIPEVDTDILRFNDNHHCGPCDGWNGVSHSGVN